MKLWNNILIIINFFMQNFVFWENLNTYIWIWQELINEGKIGDYSATTNKKCGIKFFRLRLRFWENNLFTIGLVTPFVDHF